MNFKQFAKKIKNIDNFSLKKTKEIIISEQEYITNQIKAQIFFESKDGDGKLLENSQTGRGSYSNFTSEINAGKTFNFAGKTKQKSKNKRYFLLDTGEFFDSMKVEIKDDMYKINAKTTKDNGDLLDFYGKRILNQNEVNKGRLLRLHILPKLTEFLKDYLK